MDLSEKEETATNIRSGSRRFTYEPTDLFVPALLFLLICIGLMAWAFAHGAASHGPVHGKGAAIILLLRMLPPFAQIGLIVGVVALCVFGLICQCIRLHDDEIDFEITPQGIADIGVLSTRRLRWQEIEHVEIRYKPGKRDQPMPALFFAAKPGVEAHVDESFPGSSFFNIYGRRIIILNLRLTELTIEDGLELLRRHCPDLPVKYVEQARR